jgi:hypothetical protein
MDGETMQNEASEATGRVLELFLQRQRGRGGRLFECKTCGRRFTTFQALGGHRASHRRPSPYDLIGSQKLEAACAPGPSVHGCPICGVEFTVGHMRRHRAVAASAGAQGSSSRTATPEKCSSRATASGKADDCGEDCVRGICLELNLAPPWASCAKCQKNAGLDAKAQGVQKTLVFDCIL